MCDYFWQRMENSRGDLADIVRSGSRTGAPNATEFDPALALSPTWLVPPPPPPFTSSEPEPLLPCGPGGTQSPSGSFGDPLLEFFDASLALPSPSALIGEPDTMRRPPCSSDDLLRVLQNTPRPARPSPAISSSMAGSVDHGGVQILAPRTPAGIKRRKSQAKKVVCIPAPMAASSKASGEVVPSDLWAWRKYGQKPIKGSPYPRGYYRCSSSKGCSARKQVERSRTDPNMLVITYTSEHNHTWPTQRNALAGSTRSYPPKTANASKTSTPADCASAPNPAPSLKRQKLSKEEDDDDDEDVEEDGEETALRRKAATNDLVSEEDVEAFDKILHQSYKPAVISGTDEFFADLAELEADPVSLIFSKGAAVFAEANPGEEKGDEASLDSLNMFYWGDRSS